MIPLMSLISTVAWASSSRDSSSVVPVRAAWCSAEKLWVRDTKRARARGRGVGRQGSSKRKKVRGQGDGMISQQVSPSKLQTEMC